MRVAHLLLPAALGLLAGCGSGGEHVPSKFDFVDVTGTVTNTDGKPLKSGTIHFQPLDASKGREEVIAIADGKFGLKIATGQYKVALDMRGEDGAKRSLVPAKYTKYETAQLDADVKSGAVLTYNLK